MLVSLGPGAGPVAASPTVRAIQVQAGFHHACAVLTTREVECWGDNTYDELGRSSSSIVPERIAGLTDVRSIAPGAGFSECVILMNRTVKCWGYNVQGQVGGPFPPDRTSTPQTVPGLAGVTAVATGEATSCAVLEHEGEVKCWGGPNLQVGQPPDVVRTNTWTPVRVPGIKHATAVVVGSQYACVLLRNHTVKCWGDNNSRELGDGTQVDHWNATTVLAPSGSTDRYLQGVLSISVNAADRTTCALLKHPLAGTTTPVVCWGDDQVWQLGLDPDQPPVDGQCPHPVGTGVNDACSTGPVPIEGLDGATQISAGLYHECALIGEADEPDTAVKCRIPRQAETIAPLDHPVQVSEGSLYGLALLEDGTVMFWGRNQYGEIGDGTTIDREVTTPVPVPLV